MMMRVLTVQIDKQEKRPLAFPGTLKWHPDPFGPSELLKIVPAKKHLQDGDYAFSPAPDLMRIERKWGLSELSHNLFSDDYARFGRALDRLAGYPFPYLFLDCTPASLYGEIKSKSHQGLVEPQKILDALLRELDRRSIRLLWFPLGQTMQSKTRTGEILLRIFLSHWAARRSAEKFAASA